MQKSSWVLCQNYQYQPRDNWGKSLDSQRINTQKKLSLLMDKELQQLAKEHESKKRNQVIENCSEL